MIGKRPVPRGHGEQVGGALALRPERAAAARVPPRQEKGPRGVLAKARREERGLAEVPHDDVLDLVGRRKEQRRVGRLVGLRDPEHHAVVGPDRLDVGGARLLQPREHGRGPGGMDPRAPGRQDADPPVADLVDVPLDDERAVARHLPRRLPLVAQIRHEIRRGPGIEAVPVPQAPLRVGALRRRQLAGQLADRRAELRGPTRPVAVPEGHLPGKAGRRRHEDAVVGDLVDPPGGGAEHEDVAGLRLEHHLLVELADPETPARVPARQEHAVETPVRDRPRVDDRDPPRPLARAHLAANPIPGDAGPKLRELVRGIAAREHVEHALEGRPGKLGERRRAPHQAIEVLDAVRLGRDDRDDLLRQHVERVARIGRLLDPALGHARGRRGGREEIAAVLREEDAPRGFADAVARPPDALQAGRDRGRRLDLDDEVDGAHVDAELEGRGRDDRRKLAALEPVLDLEPLLPRDRPVVREGDLLAGRFVQGPGEPLRQAPAVGEDHRRPVRADELDQARVDRRPDRAARRAGRGRPRGDLVELLAELRHVLDRHLDRQLENLAASRVDDLDRPRRPRTAPAGDLAAAEKARDLLEGTLRRGKADPLEGPLPLPQLLEPFERQEEVGAALARGDRVDLVDDDRFDRRQGLARLGRQQQVERLGRRDQNVGRRPRDAGPLRRRRVARPDGDRWNAVRGAEARGRSPRCRRSERGGCARRRRRAP